ncbi:hypothetical protein PFISCL1PPCAC_20980, partial [Pristionchus fissidentatus]
PDLVIRWEIEEIDKMVDGSVKEELKLVAKKVEDIVNFGLCCNWECENPNWFCNFKLSYMAFNESGKHFASETTDKIGHENMYYYFLFDSAHLAPGR